MASSARPPYPTVGIVTVSYGSGETLPRFLDSVHHATAEVAPRVVVVDNRPSDGFAVDRVARRAGAEYLALPDNPGYGTAANRGARLLGDDVDWILIANPDLVLGPDSIDTMLAAASDERVAAIGPATFSDDGALYPSARPVPSLRQGIGHALLANIWIGNPWSNRYRPQLDLESPSRVGWLSGACVLVRRDVFDVIGGFDEAYFMYFEDVDLGYRIGRAGFENVFEPRATARHSGGHSTGGEAERRMIEEHHRSARRFLSKRYAGPVFSPLRLVLAIGLRLRSRYIIRNMPR